MLPFLFLRHCCWGTCFRELPAGSDWEERPRFEVRLDPVDAVLPTDARLLAATEGGHRRVAEAVDVHTPGDDLRCDAVRALRVRGAYVAGQTILRVVRNLDGFLVGPVREDGEHRSEDLFPCDGHLRGDLREDRGLDVVTGL